MINARDAVSGREEVFNRMEAPSWTPTRKTIDFPTTASRSRLAWERVLDARCWKSPAAKPPFSSRATMPPTVAHPLGGAHRHPRPQVAYHRRAYLHRRGLVSLGKTRPRKRLRLRIPGRQPLSRPSQSFSSITSTTVTCGNAPSTDTNKRKLPASSRGISGRWTA